jgi:plastocyanin
MGALPPRWSQAALVLALAAVLQPVADSSAEGPTIESASAGTGFVWRPSTAEVGAGGSVSFKSTSTIVPHGVSWKSGPEAPSCSGVPVDEEKAGWSGSCTFAQPGTYAFVCTVHPTEMKGTITVLSGEVPPTGPPEPGGSPESPLAGPAISALRIARHQRGASVHGSIALSQAGGGSRLQVVLLAARAKLSADRPGMTRVGRLVRSGVKPGRVAFAVSLSRPARRALRSDTRLPLAVRVVVTPPRRGAVTLERKVVLHV